jgi:hypothetical protein
MATEQHPLNPGLVDWLKGRQASLQIVKTTTTPSGQTIDWVPIESQNPSGKIATAPPAELARAGPAERAVSFNSSVYCFLFPYCFGFSFCSKVQQLLEHSVCSGKQLKEVC